MLDTLNYFPDEPMVPVNEAKLRLQPSADPIMKDQYCIVLWNDDKHSYDEVTNLVMEMTGRTHEEAVALVRWIDEQGQDIIDMNSNVPRLLETLMTPSVNKSLGQLSSGFWTSRGVVWDQILS